VSHIPLYLGYAAQCSKLATESYSADGRRMLLKMAADWLTLADMVAKRERKAKRIRSLPEAEPAPELMVAQPEKSRARRTPRKGFPSAIKVSVQGPRSTRASKSRVSR
jgi:hypothetical protein